MISISGATIVEGNDGSQNAEVVVNLTEPHGNSVTVNYSTSPGTATAGSDYTTVSGKLTFGRNDMSQVIRVPIRGDKLVEPDEYFSVQLSNAKGAKFASSSATVTILDNEPRITISDASNFEGNTDADPKTLGFVVSLSDSSTDTITVQFNTTANSATAGSDYAETSQLVTFAPGTTSQTVLVDVIGDRAVENNETLTASLTNATNAVIERASATGTIMDDEPRISIYGYTNYGDSYPFAFQVSLSNAYDEPITVYFTTLDGTASAGLDYVENSGYLTFNPGEATTQWIYVDVIDPYAYDKWFYVQLSGAPDYTVLQNDTAEGYWYYYYDYGWYDYGYYDYGYYW